MTDFSHLGEPLDAAVIGASGGIGAAFVRALAQMPGIARVHALSRSGRVPDGPRIAPVPIDIEREESIAAAASSVEAGLSAPDALRLVIVATGVLHRGETLRPEKTWRDLSGPGFAQAFAVNATGPALVAKHLLPMLPRRMPAIFAAVSARVGSISDNRAGGWYAYRASKSALNQILKCLAIEEARRRPRLVVAGMQPGTVRTGLSAPYRGGVAPDDLLDPEDAAAHLLGALARLRPEDSGVVIDWRGDIVPP